MKTLDDYENERWNKQEDDNLIRLLANKYGISELDVFLELQEEKERQNMHTQYEDDNYFYDEYSEQI